jgi:predicted nucleic acid-binding protein
MIIVVSDTSILIDLVDAGVVDAFFRLDLDVRTNGFIFHDELDEEYRQRYRGKRLFIDELSAANIERISAIHTEQQALSLADCSAFVQAESLEATLLTGDRRLRVFAEATMAVHGTIWIFDELVDRQILTPKTAVRKLSQLAGANPRLPANEIETRIRMWSDDSRTEKRE